MHGALRRSVALVWFLGWSVLVVTAAAREARASTVWSESFDQLGNFLEGTELDYFGQGWTANTLASDRSISCILGFATGIATMSSPFTLVGATPAAALSFRYGWSPGGGFPSASLEISINGGASWVPLRVLSDVPAPPGTPRTVSLADFAGIPRVLLRFQVFGGAGLTSFTLDDLVVDNGQTAVQLGAPNGGATFAGGSSQAVTWTYGGSLAGAASIALDFFDVTGVLQEVARGLPASGGTFSWTVPLVNVDKARLRIAVLDGAGGVLATDSSDRAFAIDSIAPQPVPLTSPPNGGCVAPTGKLQWGAVNFFDATMTLTIQPATGAPLVTTNLPANEYVLPGLPQSGNPYVWKITAVDAAGNSSSSALSTFLVDGTPPAAFALTGPSASNFVTSATPMTWAASSDAGCGTLTGYQLLLDSVVCATVASTQTSITPATCHASQGDHIWSVRALDGVGNTTVSATRALRIDDVGPGRAGDRVFVSGGWSSHLPFTTGVAVIQGENVYVRAAGQWCPNGCMTGPEGTADACGGFASPDATACAAGALMSIFTNFGHTCIGSLYTGASEATFANVELYPNGGTLATACTDQLTVDLVAGTPKLLTPAPYVATARPTFSWTAVSDAGAGGVHYQVYLDGQPLGASTTSTSLAAAADIDSAIHHWFVRALDALQNATDSPTANLVVDLTGPSPFSAQTTCSALPTPSLCWTGTADSSAISKFQIWVDGVLNLDGVGPGMSCSSPGVALSPGAHDWYAVAFDGAGNRTQSESAKVVIDTAPPSAPPTARTPAGGAMVYTDRPRFSWDPATDAGGIARYEVLVDGTVVGSVDVPATELTPASSLAAGPRSWWVRAYDYCNNTIESAPSQLTVFVCQAGESGPCPGTAVGICAPGTRTCTPQNTWGPCTGVVVAATEICDGLDNNCDGVTDEHCLDGGGESPSDAGSPDRGSPRDGAPSDGGEHLAPDAALDRRPPGDAGDAGSPPQRGSGCSCRLGETHPGGGLAGAGLAALALALLRARRRRR